MNEQTPEHLLTPLLMAVRWGQKDAVCHLLDSGADPNITSGRYKQVDNESFNLTSWGYQKRKYFDLGFWYISSRLCLTYGVNAILILRDVFGEQFFLSIS